MRYQGSKRLPLARASVSIAAIAVAGFIAVSCTDDTTTPALRRASPRNARFAIVPESPPDGVDDSVWAAVTAPTNVFAGTGGFSDTVVKNTLIVSFKTGTTQSQKQAIIDSIPAQAIGGTPWGAYYVQFTDTTPSNPDSASDLLIRRLAILDSNTNVLSVSIHPLTELVATYRKPVDDTSWSRQWKLDPSTTSSADPNWAQEIIKAPWAWGCSTGSSATTVAVLDSGIQAIADLTPNATSHHDYTTAGEHGTGVASLLSAVGDNHVGISGMMWNSRLMLYQAYRHAPDLGAWNLFANMEAAADSGARVISISLAKYWHVQNNRRPGGAKDSLVATSLAIALSRTIDSIRAAGKDPLIVVSASDDGDVDAVWAGMPGLAAYSSYQQNMLVVGGAALASTGQVGFWYDYPGAGSDYGPLLDVVAPAKAVRTEDSAGKIVSMDGVSAAVPLVSGIAGLLADFDPRLSAADIRSLIINGAVAGGRSVIDPSNSAHKIPLVNAYESLRLAAQRTGAPLCGNRVWVEGAAVRVQRTPSLIETIVPTGVYGSTYLSAYHGGKRFDLDYSREFTWANGTWSEQASYDYVPDSEQGGAFWSYNQADHDDKQYVSGQLHADTTTSGLPGADTVVVTFRDSLGNQTQFVKTFPVTRPAKTCLVSAATFAPDSTYTGQVCVNYDRVGSWDGIETIGQSGSNVLFPVIAPQADFILVPIATMRHTVTPGAQFTCGGTAPYYTYCQTGTYSDSSVNLAIYRINIADGPSAVWTPIALDPSGATNRDRGYYEWTEISEPGDQVVIGAGEHLRAGNIQWNEFGGVTKVPSTWTCTNGRDEWLSLGASTGAVPGTQLFAVSRPDPDPCAGDYEGGSSVAASRRTRTPPVIAPAHTQGIRRKAAKPLWKH